jgi:alginate O-acetyltransferase complex protein AlgJ
MRDAKIGRRTSWVMALVFLGLIAVPPVHQLASELRATGHWRFLQLFRETPSHTSFKRFEENLARESALATRARMAYQALLLRALGQGNEKVMAGRDGFLFFRQEIDMAAGPGFLSRHVAPVRGISNVDSRRRIRSDPIEAIVDYQRQLAARRVHLAVLLIPLKPFIYPEKVWPGYPLSAGPALNGDHARFMTKLREAGVDVVDVTDAMWRAKARGHPLYLKQDTHWSPAGLQVVVAQVAGHIRPLLAPLDRLKLACRSEQVCNFGDLLRMLETEPAVNPFPNECVQIATVLEGAHLVKGNDAAPVLLLGDSFSNVYSRPDLGWGQGAGLAEQLMLALGVRVQVIAQNGGGATISRETLAQKPQALQHKKVVLWAFSARDLYDETIAWERVPLPETAAANSVGAIAE